MAVRDGEGSGDPKTAIGKLIFAGEGDDLRWRAAQVAKSCVVGL